MISKKPTTTAEYETARAEAEAQSVIRRVGDFVARHLDVERLFTASGPEGLQRVAPAVTPGEADRGMGA